MTNGVKFAGQTTAGWKGSVLVFNRACSNLYCQLLAAQTVQKKQKPDTLMRFASLIIAEGHQDGQRAEEHDVWKAGRARSVQLERKATASLASIDVMEPNSSRIRGNPHEPDHEKFWLDIKVIIIWTYESCQALQGPGETAESSSLEKRKTHQAKSWQTVANLSEHEVRLETSRHLFWHKLFYNSLKLPHYIHPQGWRRDQSGTWWELTGWYSVSVTWICHSGHQLGLLQPKWRSWHSE